MAGKVDSLGGGQFEVPLQSNSANNSQSLITSRIRPNLVSAFEWSTS